MCVRRRTRTPFKPMRMADCGLRIEELLARSAVYHALSVLLRHPTPCRVAEGDRSAEGRACRPAAGGRWGDHPDAETMTWLTTPDYRQLPELVERLTNGRGGPLREAVHRLRAALDSVSMAQWTGEHERVFGHSVHSAAPPYELEYGEEHSHRQPQELGDIAAFYAAFGLRLSPAAHERADHIVTECDFMQYLLYKWACALDEGTAEQATVCETAARQFLAEHLGRWGVAFALRLSRAARQGVLGTIADVTLAWLVQECERMQIAVGPRDLPLRIPKERDDPTTCLPACGGPASETGGHRPAGPKTGGGGEVGCAACAPQQLGNADGRC